ncbi:uncharacterized protein LOC142521923 [Primulina tabacum]|uniref:uncharacterized protein LOC142521923 n=1 Tax=Primulina tabacum TaxID=48773 RepID=UPI003F59948F
MDPSTYNYVGLRYRILDLIVTTTIVRNLELRLLKNAIQAVLFVLPMLEFNIILGMDYLTLNGASIEFRQRHGVEVDPSKIKAVSEYSVPKSVTEIRSFLGLAGYYRLFIPCLSSTTLPLTALAKKNVKFIWGSSCQENFEKVNQALTSAPVLSMPSGQREYVLYTDASKLGLDAVLMQNDRRFELALYARTEAPNLGTTTVQLNLRDRIREGQYSEEKLRKWRLRDESKGRKLYSEEDGIVLYRDQLWVPNGDSLRDVVMKKAHNTSYSIHPGSTKMYKDLQTLYWWPSMKQYLAFCVRVFDMPAS